MAFATRQFGAITIQGLRQIDGQSPLAYMPGSYQKIGVGYGISFEAIIQQR
jgi:hypothetical protein